MNTISLDGCVSYSDVCRRLGLPVNGAGIRKAKNFLKSINFDVSIFSDKKWYKSKYETIEKQCPVCEKKFSTQLNHSKEKTVCSVSCSNSFFRSGKDNGQFIHGANSINKDTGRTYNGGHRYLCFCFWKHECAIPGCGWDKVVEVHHIDGNHFHNVKENLIPLCPNHHRLTVTNEYKDEINNIISELMKLKFT